MDEEYKAEIADTKAIREKELAIEKQKTRTERVKQGTAKKIVGLIGGVIIGALALVATTWIVSLFLPENVEKAIEIIRRTLTA